MPPNISLGVEGISAQDVLFGPRGRQHHHGNIAELLVRLDLGEHFVPVFVRQVQELHRGRFRGDDR